MHLRRALFTITLAAALPVLATPAHAVTCPLITDATGDSRAPGPLYSANVDIVSADIASGATTVTAQLRLASIDIEAPAGHLAPRWDVDWTINGTKYNAQVRRVLVFGTYVSELYIGTTSAGPVPFTVDLATDTITWTIPRSLIPDLATPGQTFTELKAVTFTQASNNSADAAVSAQTFVDQDTVCITAA